ncbi:uncharacterized protein LOC116341774 isoform X2 [Contarinia nasturtii]|uniref:uncharacterized protein LOC116341774 isoform X2 n=1 Tax=Contarinia nasturtii TaxID=265458 RepID=UPI0012D3C6A2|nr:uncharacterized protein LOC116341774 isoform X2 [Contarinia nasturtii]
MYLLLFHSFGFFYLHRRNVNIIHTLFLLNAFTFYYTRQSRLQCIFQKSEVYNIFPFITLCQKEKRKMPLSKFSENYLEMAINKHRNSLHNHTDVFMLVTHVCLLSKEFSFVGTAREYMRVNDLPDNWNQPNGKYGMRYMRKELIYNLTISTENAETTITLMEMSTKHGHTIKVNTDIVATIEGDLKAIIPRIYMFWDRVVKELIRPTLNLPPDSDERCTSSASSTSSDLNVDDFSDGNAEKRQRTNM